jgi:long-chain acyl-CoA synthetase
MCILWPICFPSSQNFDSGSPLTMVFEPPLSVHETLAMWAGRTPNNVAVICGKQTLTYGELASATAAVANSLKDQGIEAEDRVAVETHNPVDHLVGIIAAMAVGAIPAPLPPDAPIVYQEIVADSAPRLILAGDGPDQAEKPDVDVPRKLIRDLRSGNPDLAILERRPEMESIAMFYYTSGTTSGVRKGVMQSYRALYNTARYITEVMRIDGSIREFVASPVDNAFWFGRVRVILHNGGAAVLNEGALNPLRIVAALSRFECNSLSGDTPIFVMLLHRFEGRLRALGPQFRWAKVASQAMAIEDKRALAALMPNARVVMNYGLTEAMRCCILPFADFPEKMETVGRPCPTVEARVVDEHDNLRPPGETGEIQVRGANLASGYWRNDALWRQRTKSGWYATGDMGIIDADGFVTVKGRFDEAVNVGGRTVAPIEVERAVGPMLHAEHYAVCGMTDPDGLLGDILCLCIEGEWKEPVAWNEFRIKLFEVMPAALVPKDAFAIPELPRTANGKIQRNKLRAALAAGSGHKL